MERKLGHGTDMVAADDHVAEARKVGKKYEVERGKSESISNVR